jgi:predicted dehydrogenase
MHTRREFLAGAAAVLAAGAAPLTFAQDTLEPTASAPAPAGDQKPLGWCMVGIGKLSKEQLIPAIAKCTKSKLLAIVTGHAEANQPICDQFGISPANVYNYDNYDKIADNPAIDVINIVLPTGMHAEYTIRAFKAGKHVLTEKPMANTSADCQSMIDAGKAANKKLMVAYRIRREPHNLKAIEICQSGQFGKPRLIIADHGFNIQPNVWRLDKKLAGGGALYDIGIYSLNATRYLTGEEPIAVTAQQTDNPNDPRFAQVEEGMVWTMKFPSGTLATCTTSYNEGGANHIRVIFEHGDMDMEPATAYHNNRLRVRREVIDLPDVDQFQLQTDYFSDCVINNREPITPGEEGLRDIRIIEAIYESARTGKTINLA